MELDSSSTQRGLNVKMKIGGFEALDLISCLIIGATLNLFIGHTKWGLPIVISLPSVFLIVLHFSKRGKPDNYLKHLIKFYLTDGFHSAAKIPSQEQKMRKTIYEDKK